MKESAVSATPLSAAEKLNAARHELESISAQIQSATSRAEAADLISRLSNRYDKFTSEFGVRDFAPFDEYIGRRWYRDPIDSADRAEKITEHGDLFAIVRDWSHCEEKINRAASDAGFELWKLGYSVLSSGTLDVTGTVYPYWLAVSNANFVYILTRRSATDPYDAYRVCAVDDITARGMYHTNMIALEVVKHLLAQPKK